MFNIQMVLILAKSKKYLSITQGNIAVTGLSGEELLIQILNADKK